MCHHIIKAVGQFLFQNACQVTTTLGEMHRLFMMGSIKAVQDK